MGKYRVPTAAMTPVDRLRESLDKAERLIGNLRKAGPRVLELLHCLDQIADALEVLEESEADVRAERVRMEIVQRQLRRQQARFVGEAGGTYQEERAAVQPDRARWWWFLDEAVSRQRREQLRRGAVGALVGAVVLVVVWFVYDRFIAPPPEVREAYRLSSSGEGLAEQGDLEAALAEFETAVSLTPGDAKLWMWQGVLHAELEEAEKAQAAFDKAGSLYDSQIGFLLDRSMAYLRVGNLDAADADVEEAIVQDPESGWPYYVRSGIEMDRGNCMLASTDLELAAELANQAGDTQLEALARTQRAMVMQSCVGGFQPTAVPE
jgi:tetratricopeptide (TPR) repeat protein